MPKDAVISDPRDAAKEAGLVYVNDDMPGITRIRSGKGFSYRGPDGKAIKEAAARYSKALAEELTGGAQTLASTPSATDKADAPVDALAAAPIR